MKKNYIHVLIVFIVSLLALYALFNIEKKAKSTVEELRITHQEYLKNSPFKERRKLSKKERKALAIPPNGYYEQMWELTMDPALGYPTPERTFEVQMRQRELNSKQKLIRGVGGDGSNPWVSRGPSSIIGRPIQGSNSHGGRTRAIMFDPNDVGVGNGDSIDYNRVFAGSVSGGLWVNEDITDPNSSWQLVNGLAANLAVNVMIYDPNDHNTFFIGTGESYTQGDVIGNGIWRSEDGGVTWTQVLMGYDNTSLNGSDEYPQAVNGYFYVNDLIARDTGSSTELYAAIASSPFADGFSNQGQWNGPLNRGIQKSTNNGNSWSEVFAISSGEANDLELDVNNNIWLATSYSSTYGEAGGKIYRSINGVDFTLEHNFGDNFGRTEIECSQTNVNTIWIATSEDMDSDPNALDWEVELFRTDNAFNSAPIPLNEPNDADNSIGAADFARTQSWYNLTIEADASNNLIVGGINLFRSTNQGSNWSQISKWANYTSMNTLNVSFVHADQHATVQRPGSGNENKYVFGTDGGVFYSDNITTAASSSNAIQDRNKDYSTIQFYSGAFTLGGNGFDDFIGGTQDNGTSYKEDAGATINQFTDEYGGDGGYSEFDTASNYLLRSSTRNRHDITLLPSNNLLGDSDRVSSGNGGSFINIAVLDKNLDILYSDSSDTGFSIERNSNILTGNSINVIRTQLTDALLNEEPTALQVSPHTLGSTKLYVGLRNGELLRVDNANGSDSWTSIGSFTGSISDIELGANDSEIFVTMHNYGVPSVWYTSNGGSSWQSKEGDLPDIPVKCILQNPLRPQEVILGTKIGVWATENFNQVNPTWIQTQNGMSEVSITDLDYRDAGNKILATTFGRGMFTSQFTSIPLGVEDESIVSNDVRVYPTIGNGRVNFKSNFDLGSTIVEIYSISGQRMYLDEINLSAQISTIDLNLATGMYLVKLNNDQRSITKRIIIQ